MERPPAMNPFQPLALRSKEAAKALGISARHLWQLTHDGHVPCVRIGSGKRRTVLYPPELLREWLALKAQDPGRNEQET
jgi:excisionase family DNA binding protein